MRYKNDTNQSGIALITAILIVAIVSTSAVYLIDSGYTVLRKTQQRIENEQLLQLASAVENYGINVLYWDNWFDRIIEQQDQFGFDLPRPSIEEDNPLGYEPYNDSLFESWSNPQTPKFIKTELKGDYVKNDVLYITDMNRFFNINNLHFSNSIGVKQAFENNVRIFKELLRQLDDKDIDPDKITNEIIDWLDHDNDSRSAILLTEDDVYLRAGSSYRPANRPISSIGELKHVLGMNSEIMGKLSKFVVSLPVYSANFAPYKQAFSPYVQGSQESLGQFSPALTRINVNTCPPELLAALFALYDNQAGLNAALSKQGYFQNIGSNPEAEIFSTFFSKTIPLTLDSNADSGEVQVILDAIKDSINLVASEYSEFFLIESFFQKNSGTSFNLESLVFKSRTEFTSRPVVIRRQFDWLPLYKLNDLDEEEFL